MENVTLCFITCDMHNKAEQCLSAIIQYCEGSEIIALQNGCVPTYLQNRDDINLISTPTRVGISIARNLCLSVATGDIIIWLDDDILPTEPFIDAFVQPFVNDPLVGVVGYDGCAVCEFEKWHTNDMPTHWRVDAKADNVDYFDSPYAIKKAMIDTIGSYDENIGLIDGDNTELHTRARMNGWKLCGIENPGLIHWRESTRRHFVGWDVQYQKTLNTLQGKYSNIRQHLPQPSVFKPALQLPIDYLDNPDMRFLSEQKRNDWFIRNPKE